VTRDAERTGDETTISDALESIGLSADEVTLDAFLDHFARTWGVDLESPGSVTMLPDFSMEADTSGSVLSEEEMQQAQESAYAMLTGFPDQADAAASLLPSDDARAAETLAMANDGRISEGTPLHYGRIGKLTAHPGQRDTLASILLRAADVLGGNDDCIHYLISTTDEADVVWVTETWTTKHAHEASLELAEVRALITHAMPLIATMSDQREFHIIGGKGF
jgi:quinol monooxygenase YgiN